LTVLDAATGRSLAARWWDERHDRPSCAELNAGVVTCTSNALGVRVFDLASLEPIDERSTVPAPPRRTATSCLEHRGEVDGTTFQLTTVHGTSRRSVEVVAGESRHRCEHEILQGHLVCDVVRDALLAVPHATAMALVSDLGSTIADRQRLSVAAVDEACNIRWRYERARGTVEFSAVLAEHVVLAVSHGVPTETSRTVLVALRPEDGTVAWEHAF
jgi:hypothetical protein